jgi:glycosyltransferase involved in cell wall biosynthesis
MRVAMISTVYKRTPPLGYGGIERVVHTLTEELIRQGHEVTLFATPGSRCSGRTVEIDAYDPSRAPSGIRSKADALSEEPLYRTMVREVTRDGFDVIHDFSFQNLFTMRHPERVPFIISTCIPLPPDTDRPNLVACSAAHARSINGSTRFVRYGLNLADWPFRLDKERHLVHIAKIAPYKGQHEAVLAATLAGRRLHLVGNIEHQLYHRAVVAPLAALLPRISYHGEATSTSDALLPAAALIQTPKWFDAFPLIVLEALASATPVIAYGEGGVVEQIEDGVNGFLCRGVRELAEKIGRLDELRPRHCRDYAETHFSVARMARDYRALYERVIDGESW